MKWGPLTLEDSGGSIVPTEAGINRFGLPIQFTDIKRVAGQRGGGITDPLIVPGMYQVRLTVGEQTWTQPVEKFERPADSTSRV